MIFERIKSEGLAHNSYLIGSQRHAAVIDPRRDCQVYIDIADRDDLAIRYVFETHRNEDYVIGSRELADSTGAEILHGPRPDWGYGNIIEDGAEFNIGSLVLRAIHTPGHTDESMSYAVTDVKSGLHPVVVFTGDALFVDEVGRVDLYGPQEVKRLAGELYDSIFGKLLPLGDGVILCPAHGAGSVCGRSISRRDESTLGIERAQNPRLQLSRRAFIAEKSAEQLEMPPYFMLMEKHNLEGPPILGGLPEVKGLRPAEFKLQMEQGAIVVDTSYPPAFSGAHIKRSYSIWLDGLPVFSGWVLPYDRPILLVLEDESHLDAAARYLVRVGLDSIVGYLRGGVEAWYDAGYPFQSVPTLSVHHLKEMLEHGDHLTVLDVRSQEEWDRGHIDGALHIYVGHLKDRVLEVAADHPIAVLCSVGHRTSLAASILQMAGFSQVYNVLGSMTAWRAAGYPVTPPTERPQETLPLT